MTTYRTAAAAGVDKIMDNKIYTTRDTKLNSKELEIYKKLKQNAESAYNDLKLKNDKNARDIYDNAVLKVMQFEKDHLISPDI